MEVLARLPDVSLWKVGELYCAGKFVEVGEEGGVWTMLVSTGLLDDR